MLAGTSVMVSLSTGQRALRLARPASGLRGTPTNIAGVCGIHCMAKYYVHSGRLRGIISCPTREQAAFHVIHREARTGDGRFLPPAALRHLGLVTTVSESGFTGRDAFDYPTDAILRGSGPFGKFDGETEPAAS